MSRHRSMRVSDDVLLDSLSCCGRGDAMRLTALLSVAKLSFLICSAASTRSSVLPLALKLVMGVLPPPVVEALGVVFPLTDFLAAFSARRFCLDAEGGMVKGSLVGLG